jgi:hypothetical protein
MRIENGWFTKGGKVIWGMVHHNGWWGGFRHSGKPFVDEYKLRMALTRNAPGESGPCRTEDLDRLTDAMAQYRYPGFEHNYGLWYDRRRDAHDKVARSDDQALAPFLEMPWARSEEGRAWDGLPKYDLTRFNPWYFDRLKAFAHLCEQKGLIFFHSFYMQHNLLESMAHYVDFPWRPNNCIQETGMPEYPDLEKAELCAANDFYSTDRSAMRELHSLYIQKCLEVLGQFDNVVFSVSQEFTGPLSFVHFWLEELEKWETRNRCKLKICMGATKDVLDAVLTDAHWGPRISVIDLRYWWYERDGSLYAPTGGHNIPARYVGKRDTTLAQSFRQIVEYRKRYPEKAIPKKRPFKISMRPLNICGRVFWPAASCPSPALNTPLASHPMSRGTRRMNTSVLCRQNGPFPSVVLCTNTWPRIFRT